MKKEYWILSLIFLIGIFLRFYKINLSPPGLYLDEASIGYNAFSVLKTGNDEFGKGFPVFFRSFGDYKMPLYIYLTTIPIKLFDLNVFSVRFVSALFGSLSIILVYFLSKRLFPSQKKELWLIASLLFSISPWSVFFSRAAFEASPALFFFLIGLYFQLNSIGKDRYSKLNLFSSIIFYSASTYSYHTERLIAPVVFFLILITQTFNFRTRLGNSLKMGMLSLFLFFILLFPQIILFNSAGGQSRISSLTVGATQKSVSQKIAMYTEYFSPKNLFYSPDSDLQRSFPRLSVFYSWMVIPFFIGLWILIKSKDSLEKKVLIILLAISPIPASLAKDPFSSVRSYPLIFPLTIVISLGIIKLSESLNRRSVLIIFGTLSAVSIIQLWNNIFYLLPHERFTNWSYGYSELTKKIEEGGYEKVLVNHESGVIYSEILFFQKYPPEKFQLERNKNNDLINYYSKAFLDSSFKWGNIDVRSLVWGEDIYIDQLIIASPIAISEGQAKEHFLYKTFDIIGPDGKIVFSGYLTNPQLKKIGKKII